MNSAPLSRVEALRSETLGKTGLLGTISTPKHDNYSSLTDNPTLLGGAFASIPSFNIPKQPGTVVTASSSTLTPAEEYSGSSSHAYQGRTVMDNVTGAAPSLAEAVLAAATSSPMAGVGSLTAAIHANNNNNNNNTNSNGTTTPAKGMLAAFMKQAGGSAAAAATNKENSPLKNGSTFAGASAASAAATASSNVAVPGGVLPSSSSSSSPAGAARSPVRSANLNGGAAPSPPRTPLGISNTSAALSESTTTIDSRRSPSRSSPRAERGSLTGPASPKTSSPLTASMRAQREAASERKRSSRSTPRGGVSSPALRRGTLDSPSGGGGSGGGWQSAFSTRVTNIGLSLDDAMSSMEGLVSALEKGEIAGDHAVAAVKDSDQLTALRTELEKKILDLESQISVLRHDLRSAEEEASAAKDSALALTHQCSIRTENVTQLETALSERNRTVDELKETVSVVRSKLEAMTRAREEEEGRRKVTTALNRELNATFVDKFYVPVAEYASLREELTHMKMNCFMSNALAVKQSYSLGGVPTNHVNVQSMWSAVSRADLPSTQWAAFIDDVVFHRIELAPSPATSPATSPAGAAAVVTAGPASASSSGPARGSGTPSIMAMSDVPPQPQFVSPGEQQQQCHDDGTETMVITTATTTTATTAAVPMGATAKDCCEPQLRGGTHPNHYQQHQQQQTPPSFGSRFANKKGSTPTSPSLSPCMVIDDSLMSDALMSAGVDLSCLQALGVAAEAAVAQKRAAAYEGTAAAQAQLKQAQRNPQQQQQQQQQQLAVSGSTQGDDNLSGDLPSYSAVYGRGRQDRDLGHLEDY